MPYTPVPTVAAGDWIDEIFINTYWRDNMAASIPDVFSAKGQLAVASDVNAMGVLNVGLNGSVLVADSAQSLGVKWEHLLNQIYTPQNIGLNYQISRSVATNDLTVAIKDKDGNDPSSTSPATFRIGNTLRSLTAALSITALDGSNYCLLGSAELAAKDTDLFVYMGWRASNTSLFLAVSRIPWAITYADFSGTLANAKYAIYSGAAPASTDEVVCIGRINAQLSASPNFQWSIPATSVIVNAPIFESRILDWQPTFTGYSANPTGVYRYWISGQGGSGNIFIVMRETISGTSNATTKTYTLPFPASEAGGFAIPFLIDNGATNACGYALITFGSQTLTCNKSTGAAWTASGGASIGQMQGFYRG